MSKKDLKYVLLSVHEGTYVHNNKEELDWLINEKYVFLSVNRYRKSSNLFLTLHGVRKLASL